MAGAKGINEEESWPILGLPESSEKEAQAGRIQTDPEKFLQQKIKEEIILPNGEDWWWGEAEKAPVAQTFYR